MWYDNFSKSAQTNLRRFPDRLAVLLLFMLIAGWSLWPLPKSPAHTFPVGNAYASTVELLNVWTIWWNSDRAAAGFFSYWKAPIFFPYGDSFAFSEPQPMTVLVAPVIWFTGSRVLAYNLYLWFTLVLNGALATRFLRTISVGRWMAVAGGTGLLLLPMVHGQRDVLQLCSLWGILWVWSAFLDISRGPTLRSGFELGLAFTCVVFTSVHHALFLLILMICAGWTTCSRWRQPKFWTCCAVGLFTTALFAGPLLLQLKQVMQHYEFSRPPEKVLELSAIPSDYLKSAGQTWFTPQINIGRPDWRLGAGWLRSIAAVVGIVFGLRRHRRRATTLFLTTILIVGFLLSLGLNLRVGDWQPWHALSEFFPGIAQVRSPFRFSYFVQMSVLLLAAQGLYDVWLFSNAWLGRRRWFWSRRVAFGTLALLIAFEVCPGRLILATAPHVTPNEDWVTWIREQQITDEGVLCLPMAPGNLMQDFQITTEWMYFGTFHGAPLMNGYSGYFPEEYLLARDRLREEFPSVEMLDYLQKRRIGYVVINHSRRSAPSAASMEPFSNRCVPVFRSRANVVIYRLEN